ncbi:MAG: phytanoyl-CoA dioxygenase family protein [Pirellulaceae bacterium]
MNSQKMSLAELANNGFTLLQGAVVPSDLARLSDEFQTAFENATSSAFQSRGRVYAARNVIDLCPFASEVWRTEVLHRILNDVLGADFGLVRALYFDKPPNRTWSLAMHKDTSIAVKSNDTPSSWFSRPTRKANVPHVIAHESILENMLTLRIHLDSVDKENGPLEVIAGSHKTSKLRLTGEEVRDKIFADRGDVLAMRPLLTHGSGASAPGTLRHRRILHLEFAADRSLPDGYQWHHFIR